MNVKGSVQPQQLIIQFFTVKDFCGSMNIYEQRNISSGSTPLLLCDLKSLQYRIGINNLKGQKKISKK